jgi:hypothetical protein
MEKSILLDRRLIAFSQIGLRLVDDFTGQAPFGQIETYLDIRNGNGNWQETNIQPQETPTSILTYPNLERHADATGLATRVYRVRLECEFYQPEYLAVSDGFEFDVIPFSDESLPALQPGSLRNINLLPASNYPHSNLIPVLRGVVENTNGIKLKNVLVFHSLLERVITDERGEFGLPLRIGVTAGPVTIDAAEQRTGRTGSITITFPKDLALGVTIIIP